MKDQPFVYHPALGFDRYPEEEKVQLLKGINPNQFAPEHLEEKPEPKKRAARKKAAD